jgi:hypothetical protein
MNAFAVTYRPADSNDPWKVLLSTICSSAEVAEKRREDYRHHANRAKRTKNADWHVGQEFRVVAVTVTIEN